MNQLTLDAIKRHLGWTLRQLVHERKKVQCFAALYCVKDTCPWCGRICISSKRKVIFCRETHLVADGSIRQALTDHVPLADIATAYKICQPVP